MEDPPRVRGSESACDGLRDLEGALFAQRSRLMEQSPKGFALDPFHRNVQGAGALVQIVDTADARMADLARQAHLVLESLDIGRCQRQLRTDQLERHHLIEYRVDRLVDDSHP